MLSEVINFVFESKVRKRIGFFKTSISWTPKRAGRRYFMKQTLANAMSFFENKCFFTIGNMVFKQDIVIPMGIDPAPSRVNLFFYFFESKYIKQLISNGSCKVHKYGVCRFINDLCAINDGNEFLTFKNIYPKKLGLKVEHQGNQTLFLDLEIKIKDSVFVYKLFDKRDKFPFFIV